MNFLDYMEKYEKADVSAVRSILESRQKKENMVLSAVFTKENEFKSKKVAKLTLETMKTHSGSVGTYVRENYEMLTSKIDMLSEGDIKIIIHNCDSGCSASTPTFETEGRRKRGRPSKVGVAPIAPLYYADNTDTVGVATEGEIEDNNVGDVVFDKGRDSDVDGMSDDDIIKELASMELSDEELKEASDSVENDAELKEGCSDRVKRASTLIKKVSKK